MKGFDMKKIIAQVKEKENEGKEMEKLINHLLPTTTRELREAIVINSMLDNNY